MRSPNSNTQSSRRQWCMFFVLLLLIAVPIRSARATQAECEILAKSQFQIVSASKEDEESQNAVANKLKPLPSKELLACWVVLFYWANQSKDVRRPLSKWQIEQIDKFEFRLSTTEIWNLCYNSPCKTDQKHSKWYLGKLTETCEFMASSHCTQVVKEYNIATNPPPPPLLPKKLTPAEKVGKGFLIGAVVLGSASMILGAMHMITPVFQEPVSWASCEANGLRLPCVADRFPTGGGLLGGGAALVIGGAVTWGLKF